MVLYDRSTAILLIKQAVWFNCSSIDTVFVKIYLFIIRFVNVYAALVLIARTL